MARDATIGPMMAATPFTIINNMAAAARFSSGMLSLARRANAPILPIFCELIDGEAVLTVDAPITVDEAHDRETGLSSGLQEYVRRLEARVRREPGRFRNWHLAWEPAYEVPA